MDWSPVYKVASLAFVIGIVFGAVANKTNFCSMGAVSDWVNMGDKNCLRVWFLAIGIAILLSQGMQYAGLFDLGQASYLTIDFRWLGYLLGGALFGIGMTLASIIFGSALTMKVEYYLMDGTGFFSALRHALADMRPMPAGRGRSK